MAKIYGLHEVKLQPGVTGEQYETFMREEFGAVSLPTGYKMYLMRKRLGPGGAEYLIGFVVDGGKYHHDHPEYEADIQQWFVDHAELEERRKKLATSKWVADYIIVGEFE